jgi:hypothetical protein
MSEPQEHEEKAQEHEEEAQEHEEEAKEDEDEDEPLPVLPPVQIPDKKPEHDEDEPEIVHEDITRDESDGTLTNKCLADSARVKLEMASVPTTSRSTRVPAGKKPVVQDVTTTASEDQGSSWSHDERERRRIAQLNPKSKPGLAVNKGPVRGKAPHDLAKNPSSPSPNKSSVQSVKDKDEDSEIGFGNPSVSSTPRRELLFSGNVDEIDKVAQEILSEVRSLREEMGSIKNKLDVLTNLLPRDHRFIVLPGSSVLFEQILQTVHSIVQFPFHTLEQANFHTRLLRKFECYAFVLNVFFFNNTGGGSVFTVCNNLWSKMYSNTLSKKLAWADIGESAMVAEDDDDDDEQGGRKKRLGKNKRPFHKLRSENPELRNLMMRKY